MSSFDGRSLYETLGVPASAEPHDIRAAYHHLARELHPDRHPDKEAEFKEVQRAYETLSDPNRRACYDLIGRDLTEEGLFADDLVLVAGCSLCCSLCCLLLFGLLALLRVESVVNTPVAVIFTPLWTLDLVVFVPTAVAFARRRNVVAAAEAAVFVVTSVTLYAQCAGLSDSWARAAAALVVHDVCRAVRDVVWGPDAAYYAGRALLAAGVAAKLDGSLAWGWWAVCLPVLAHLCSHASQQWTQPRAVLWCVLLYVVFVWMLGDSVPGELAWALGIVACALCCCGVGGDGEGAVGGSGAPCGGGGGGGVHAAKGPHEFAEFG
eukprot:Rhum_TRINITY_DN1094_c0_g1::Rhum_TRINITY_DN1094_c0_g1_i1::g.3252::m.3252